MPISTVQLVVRTGSGLQVRAEPVRISWLLDDLAASDGHKLRCTFAATVRVIDKPAELQLLCESLMQSAASVTSEMVKSQWADPLRAAAAAAMKSRTGQEATDDAGRVAILANLTQEINKLAFVSGMEILPPCQVDTESPTLTRQRVETMRRQAAEERAAGQIKQLEQAAGLLARFEQLRQDSPQLSPGRILGQLDPAEQADMLQSLLLASSQKQQTQSLWVVAGPNLAQIDPTAPATAPRLRPMPSDLGPLRSVNRCDDGTLLIGARTGIYVVDPSSDAPPLAFSDPAVVSQMGFGQTLHWGDELWACHSEAGVAGWKTGSPVRPYVALRPPQLKGASPRNLTALDASRLLFSSGPRLMLLSRQDEENIRVSACGADAPSEIIAVLHAGDVILTVLRDGAIETRQIDDLDVIERRTAAGTVSAACLLPWLGEWRILLAQETGPVICTGIADALITQFAAPYRGLKAISAAADVVAAVVADRQRVVWWQTTSPAKLHGDVYIMPTMKHRAGDVAV